MDPSRSGRWKRVGALRDLSSASRSASRFVDSSCPPRHSGESYTSNLESDHNPERIGRQINHVWLVDIEWSFCHAVMGANRQLGPAGR